MKGTRGLKALALASLIVAVIAGPQGPTALAAATITVTTTDDELNTDGDCSLREAIQAANTDFPVDFCPAGSGADTIVVPAGTYALTIPNCCEDANATGDLDVTTDVTITGAGSASTIVSGGLGFNDRIFDVIPGNGTVTISGLTVSGGQPVALAPDNGNGGGIREQGFSLDLTLSHVVLSENTAPGQGGGLYSETGGTLALTNVTATSNTAVNQGGGIRTANASSSMTNLTLTDNWSTGQTSSSQGGGAYIQDVSTTITGLTATGNTATLYGGLALFGGGGVLEVATISANTADTIGGGLRVGDGWTIRRASITGNQSVGEAGGVHAEGSAVIEDTTIDSNTARQPAVGTSGGGGIFGLGFTLERVAVTNNTATGFGGGIHVNCCLATHLTNVTISGNAGGGFSGGWNTAQSEVVLRNVTIADNSPGTIGDCGFNRQCASAIETFGGYVVLENDIVEGLEPLVSGGIVDNGHNLYSNTLAGIGLGPLASNDGPAQDPPDGPTKTHALLSGSPAIDDGSSNCPATDQRGFARPQDGDLDDTPICDIGAYEFVPAGVDGAMDVIVTGPTKSLASGGSRKAFVTKVCNVGTAGVTVDPVADIATSITVNGAPAGGTVTVTNPTPTILRQGACQRYRWEWSYGPDGPANPGDTVVFQATWNLTGDSSLANNTDSETRTAT